MSIELAHSVYNKVRFNFEFWDLLLICNFLFLISLYSSLRIAVFLIEMGIVSTRVTRSKSYLLNRTMSTNLAYILPLGLGYHGHILPSSLPLIYSSRHLYSFMNNFSGGGYITPFIQYLDIRDSNFFFFETTKYKFDKFKHFR